PSSLVPGLQCCPPNGSSRRVNRNRPRLANLHLSPPGRAAPSNSFVAKSGGETDNRKAVASGGPFCYGPRRCERRISIGLPPRPLLRATRGRVLPRRPSHLCAEPGPRGQR